MPLAENIYFLFRRSNVQKYYWSFNNYLGILPHKCLQIGHIRPFSNFSCMFLNPKYLFQFEFGILLLKLFWPTVRKNCSSDWEKLWRLKAENLQNF